MALGKELSIFLANKPGQLARACAALASARVDIRAISVHDSVDLSIVRMVVDNPKRAVGVLAREAISATESDVVMLSLANKPGELGKVATRLARAKVNIDYVYGSTQERTGKVLLVLRVSNPRKAADRQIRDLSDHGIGKPRLRDALHRLDSLGQPAGLFLVFRRNTLQGVGDRRVRGRRVRLGGQHIARQRIEFRL